MTRDYRVKKKEWRPYKNCKNLSMEILPNINFFLNYYDCILPWTIVA